MFVDTCFKNEGSRIFEIFLRCSNIAALTPWQCFDQGAVLNRMQAAGPDDLPKDAGVPSPVRSLRPVGPLVALDRRLRRDLIMK